MPPEKSPVLKRGMMALEIMTEDNASVTLVGASRVAVAHQAAAARQGAGDGAAPTNSATPA